MAQKEACTMTESKVSDISDTSEDHLRLDLPSMLTINSIAAIMYIQAAMIAYTYP